MRKVSFLILFIPFFIQAQINDKPFIEVVGTAELEVVPDEIYISITLKEGKDSRTVSEQESDLKSGLQRIGIELEYLTLSDANANYVKVKWGKDDVIGSTQYQLKVNSANRVGAVFQMLDEIKIEGAYISKVDHSEIEKLKKEVRIDAIKAAKEKADYLLEAVGSKSGKPLIVHENNAGAVYKTEEANTRRGYANSQSIYIENKGEDDQIVHFRKITITSNIYVKFEIL